MRPSSIHPKQQNGQAIVLVAITMVIMLAFTGLAIDGGGAFLLYRDVQNATDSAALSAAFALCSDGDPVSAGMRSASVNGFTDPANPPPTNNAAPAGTTTGESVTVLVENPPTVGDYAGNSNYVRVRVTAVKPSYFIQVVYGGPITITAETTSQCNLNNEYNALQNAAVVTLRQVCSSQESIRFRGTSDTDITGDVYINQTCTSNDSVKTNGNADAIVDGQVCSQGTINDSPPFQDPSGNPLPSSDVQENNGCNVDPITDPEPFGLGTSPEAQCGSTNLGSMSGNNTFSPGTYSDIDIKPSHTAFMEEGIYCVRGDIDIKGDLDSLGDGVFIYQSCSNCTFNITSQANVDLTALIDSNPWSGILLYSRADDSQVNNAIQINGGGGALITGSVYAPYAHCDIVGGSSSVYVGQFICYSADLGGNADTVIIFDPGVSAIPPPSFGVTE